MVIPAELRTGERTFGAWATSLSPGGVFLRCRRPLSSDGRFELRIESHGVDPVSLRACVVHQDETGTGLAFVGDQVGEPDYTICVRGGRSIVERLRRFLAPTVAHAPTRAELEPVEGLDFLPRRRARFPRR